MTIWMNRNIMLRKTSQTQKSAHCTIPFPMLEFQKADQCLSEAGCQDVDMTLSKGTGSLGGGYRNVL